MNLIDLLVLVPKRDNYDAVTLTYSHAKCLYSLISALFKESLYKEINLE